MSGLEGRDTHLVAASLVPYALLWRDFMPKSTGLEAFKLGKSHVPYTYHNLHDNCVYADDILEDRPKRSSD